MAQVNPLRELVDAFSELVAQHVRLARLEVKEDARFVGIRVGVIAVFTPLILVGYGFLCVALALSLRRFLGDGWAFLLVGLVNLLVSGIGIAIAANQLSKRKLMNATVLELETSSAMVLPPPNQGRS
ncbi:MAG: phage holin family protein [Archangium sp.]|nr:phage holin family protein [Archangium sp.]